MKLLSFYRQPGSKYYDIWSPIKLRCHLFFFSLSFILSCSSTTGMISLTVAQWYISMGAGELQKVVGGPYPTNYKPTNWQQLCWDLRRPPKLFLKQNWIKNFTTTQIHYPSSPFLSSPFAFAAFAIQNKQQTHKIVLVFATFKKKKKL